MPSHATRSSWKAGQSGNPNGRRVNLLELRDKARQVAADTLQDLAEATPLPQKLSNPQCKVCRSINRTKVEEWRANGLSPTIISQRLQQEPWGESISDETIRKHFLEHVDMAKLVAAYYAKTNAEADSRDAVQVSDLERIDAAIRDCHRMRHVCSEMLEGYVARGKQPNLALVQAYQAALSEARQYLKAKVELLGNQPQDEVDGMLAALWGEQGLR